MDLSTVRHLLEEVDGRQRGCGTSGAQQTALTLAAHGCPGNRVEL